jgi:hypothetical protein
MAFDWLDYEMPASVLKAIPEKTNEANRGELRARAKTLAALGYDAREIAARLRRSVEWEYGDRKTPVLDEIDDIAKDVSKRRA